METSHCFRINTQAYGLSQLHTERKILHGKGSWILPKMSTQTSRLLPRTSRLYQQELFTAKNLHLSFQTLPSYFRSLFLGIHFSWFLHLESFWKLGVSDIFPNVILCGFCSEYIQDLLKKKCISIPRFGIAFHFSWCLKTKGFIHRPQQKLRSFLNS